MSRDGLPSLGDGLAPTSKAGKGIGEVVQRYPEVLPVAAVVGGQLPVETGRLRVGGQRGRPLGGVAPARAETAVQPGALGRIGGVGQVPLGQAFDHAEDAHVEVGVASLGQHGSTVSRTACSAGSSSFSAAPMVAMAVSAALPPSTATPGSSDSSGYNTFAPTWGQRSVAEARKVSARGAWPRVSSARQQRVRDTGRPGVGREVEHRVPGHHQREEVLGEPVRDHGFERGGRVAGG